MVDHVEPMRLAHVSRVPVVLGSAVFLAVFASMLVIGRELYFGQPLHELGDLAANALQIDRAKDFGELYGNYSRFGFHHPGPAFFYVYAAAEIVFHDVLRLSPAPHNAHLLGAAIFHSSLLAITITVLARFAAPNRLFFGALAILIATAHFAVAGQHQYSIWPPSALVVPFATLIAVSVGLSAGSLQLLPVLIVIGGFLIHGHVAQPLFVLPIGMSAYVAGIRRRSILDRLGPARVVRNAIGWHLAGVLALAIFVTPIAIDALRGASSNLGAILQTLNAPREPGDTHGAWSIASYVVAFLAYPGARELNFTPPGLADVLLDSWARAAIVLLLAIGVPLVYMLRAARPEEQREGENRAREGITRIWRFVAFALGLCAVWVYMQRGPLYQFNSLFVYGLMYVAMLSGAVAMARILPRRAGTTGMLLVLGVAVIVTVTHGPPPNLGSASTIAQRTASVARSMPAADGIFLDFEGMHWGAPAGVALALERLGLRWYVPPQWELIFGSDHARTPPASAEPLLVWRLTPPQTGDRPQIVLTPEVSISPPPGQ